MQATAAAAAAPVWRRIPKIEAIVSIFLFVAAILLPVARQFIFGEPPTQSQEGRPLAPAPMWARHSPRTTAATPPPTRPTCTIEAITP